MAIHEPLDLEYWFVNVFSGSMTIFSVVSLFAISVMAGYFKMNAITYGIFMLMFGLILASQGFNGILILFILIFAPILFWWTRRIVE